MPDNAVTLMLMDAGGGDRYLVEGPALPHIVPGMIVAVGDLMGRIELCTQAYRGSVEHKMLCALARRTYTATAIYQPVGMDMGQ